MPSLLLPGTPRYDNRARFLRDTEADLVGHLLHTIKVLWAALRVLHAANAEGPCPICPSAKAWESPGLAEIRQAIEEEESDE